MANSLTACVGRFTPIERGSSRDPPSGSAFHKLDRLRELRAVIETLRCEREAKDPLLAWILERERAENRQRD